MPAVEVLRVRGLQARHDPRQRIPARLHRQMDMVAHQAIRQQPKAELLPVVPETPKVILPIRIVQENGLPLVAPDDDVVQCPRKLNPQRASHDRIVSSCHLARLTPLFHFTVEDPDAIRAILGALAVSRERADRAPPFAVSPAPSDAAAIGA